MTLPASGSISLTQVMTELRIVNPSRAYPISLGDADVRALAGVPSGVISLTNLYGKSSYIALSATSSNGGAAVSSSGGAGVATCNPSVSASGGTAPYTYLWSFTSNPDSCSLGSSLSATCAVSKAFAGGAIGSASAVLQCVITDNVGATITKTGIAATLEWEP